MSPPLRLGTLSQERLAPLQAVPPSCDLEGGAGGVENLSQVSLRSGQVRIPKAEKVFAGGFAEPAWGSQGRTDERVTAASLLGEDAPSRLTRWL